MLKFIFENFQDINNEKKNWLIARFLIPLTFQHFYFAIPQPCIEMSSIFPPQSLGHTVFVGRRTFKKSTSSSKNETQDMPFIECFHTQFDLRR